jgi:hypothetical protein
VNAAPPAALVAFATVLVKAGWVTGITEADLPPPPTTVRPIRLATSRASTTMADPFNRLFRRCR